MKNFVLKVGQPLIGIMVVLGIIMSIIYAYAIASIPGLGNYSIIAFLTIAAFGIAAVIFGAFLIYLLIDIRDNLCSINKKLGDGRGA